MQYKDLLDKKRFSCISEYTLTGYIIDGNAEVEATVYKNILNGEYIQVVKGHRPYYRIAKYINNKTMYAVIYKFKGGFTDFDYDETDDF